MGDFYVVDVETGAEPAIRKVDPGVDPPAEPATPSAPPAESERTPPEPPMIYVANLADYNAGYHHGAWIDATREPDDIRQKIADLLADSPALQAQDETFGDWAIHDYSGFGQIRLDELEDPECISALATGIAEHGDQFTAWVELQDSAELNDWAHDGEVQGTFRDAYLGEYDSLSTYGQQVVDDMGWQDQINEMLPPEVARYARIDADALAQDMWLNGEIQVAHIKNGRMVVFRVSV